VTVSTQSNNYHHEVRVDLTINELGERFSCSPTKGDTPIFRREPDPRYEFELTPQARANALFEAEMAMVRSPERTIFVDVATSRRFSDIGADAWCAWATRQLGDKTSPA